MWIDLVIVIVFAQLMTGLSRVAIHEDGILSGEIMTTLDACWIYPQGLAYIHVSQLDRFCLLLQAKEEFGSTADIVQTIQTMTANLVKVLLLVYI